MSDGRVLAIATVLGAVFAAPLGALVWLGAEHGGRGIWSIPYAVVCGAVAGFVFGLMVVGVRRLYRRITRPRSA
jgi:hypothetical protein